MVRELEIGEVQALKLLISGEKKKKKKKKTHPFSVDQRKQRFK